MRSGRELTGGSTKVWIWRTGTSWRSSRSLWRTSPGRSQHHHGTELPLNTRCSILGRVVPDTTRTL
ncbi:MAP3K epsilon protein kinase 1-like [Iris pallida]|uniref:MAP3K epsilon protein kinase 1-like n=1 Tax=Iris pallida TaxID=29817 RepID=A0AAX6FG44_IRIPA|nr:MAP3K epsilon protein kinase 1-like [Iris pallida]